MGNATKQIYLLKGRSTEDYAAFKKRALDLSNELKNISSLNYLKLTLTEEAPPRLSIIPFSSEKIAIFSFLSSDTSVQSHLDKFTGAYKVTEAIPVGYDFDWKVGEKTPGVGLLTFFKKKTNLSYPEFIKRWHEGHSTLSLEIHPIWNYNRNVVEEKIVDTSPDFDGIVEEQFRNKSELLNPTKMFGSAFSMIYNMIRVYFDVKGFIDYPSIETFYTAEYWLKR